MTQVAVPKVAIPCYPFNFMSVWDVLESLTRCNSGVEVGVRVTHSEKKSFSIVSRNIRSAKWYPGHAHLIFFDCNAVVTKYEGRGLHFYKAIGGCAPHSAGNIILTRSSWLITSILLVTFWWIIYC